MIGAGLSGICAAASLSALGHDCVLLEADNFAGGRVCSVPFSFEGSDASFDLGATWFWPETQPRMSALAALTGVDVFPQFFSGSVWVERFRLERAQRYIPATDIRTSAMRIAGGMKALIDARVASLPEQCLKLNHAVTAIEQRDDGRFCVSIAGIPTIHCEHIVLAIPPRQILQTKTFNPALPVDVQDSFRKTPTWIAGQAKAVFVYRVPFWRERSHSGMVSSVVGPLQEIYDASPASGLGALFGFFNLSPSQRMLVSE